MQGIGRRSPGFTRLEKGLTMVRWLGGLVCCVWLSGVLGIATSLTAADPGWRGALGKVNITPTSPMWMAGYASRNKPSEGVASDLFAKVLVLDDGQGERLAIVTLDLIGVPRPLRENLEQTLEKTYGLPPRALLINASHTHCGPELRARRAETVVAGGPESDQSGRVAQALEYSNRLQQQIVTLVGDCLQRLEPVRLGFSQARCGFAMNRRLPADGTFKNSPYPEGPVDHSVPVLRVESADGALRGLMFGYACHNTTLGFYEFCGDYAGFAQAALEEAHPGTIAMFVEGCGGDQNPYPRGTLELAQLHGKTLATAVEAALLPTPQPVTGRLSSALQTVTLEFAPLPERQLLEERTQSKNRYEAAHAQRILKQLDSPEGVNLQYPYLVQVIRFGSCFTMVTLAGEVVVDYSLRLKADHPEERLWVAGYSNDVFGYVPSLRVLREGGYEGGGAMLYTSLPGPFAESVEERIHAGIADLLNSTK